MGQTLYSIVNPPFLGEATAESVGALDEIARSFSDVLAGVPLYGDRLYDDGTRELVLFDLKEREEFDSRDRSADRDALVMDFLSFCAGNGGSPDGMFGAICAFCAGAQMSFQESYDDGYVAYSFEFTPTGVSGTSSSYQLDSATDEYELTDYSDYATPVAKKPVAKKPVAKKPVAKKPVAKKPVAKKPAAKKPAAKKPAAKAVSASRSASTPKGKRASGGIAGKTFLFTGTLTTMTRAEAESTVQSNGGTVLSGVTDRLDYLVVGEKAGSKLVKAKKIPSITILTEAEFTRLK